ncbi:uncharacterized protein N7473_005997 [Penicillium subrubescens]|uniref:uncharacterized protein n=1 Tax=Penicillium subrubescens TaxID=1316194 RepID=UPI002544F603|nr:uncharacterized protein N7473_005997 [Penicillium subrubescens]KAJ5896598.1 hypothetical protein N7473_005997 [Penicillium subrubescens]
MTATWLPRNVMLSIPVILCITRTCQRSTTGIVAGDFAPALPRRMDTFAYQQSEQAHLPHLETLKIDANQYWTTGTISRRCAVVPACSVTSHPYIMPATWDECAACKSAMWPAKRSGSIPPSSSASSMGISVVPSSWRTWDESNT